MEGYENEREFWQQYPTQFARNEFLRQVRKTIRGMPISKTQFKILTCEIITKLGLLRDDRVLDLCCGNGLITSVIAKRCSYIAGVDFSLPLINIAMEFHNGPNIDYHCLSAMDIDRISLRMDQPFTKVYMCEALQCFRKGDLFELLERVLCLCTDEAVILFAGVPDEQWKGDFISVPQSSLSSEDEFAGTWWDQSLIRRACRRLGLECVFLPQDASLHTARYRFDAIMGRGSLSGVMGSAGIGGKQEIPGARVRQ